MKMYLKTGVDILKCIKYPEQVCENALKDRRRYLEMHLTKTVSISLQIRAIHPAPTNHLASPLARGFRSRIACKEISQRGSPAK